MNTGLHPKLPPQLRIDDDPDFIRCVNPATLERLGEIPVTTPDEVEAMITRARAAQRDYRQTTFAQRRRLLRRILQQLLDNADAICDDVCRDSGKTRENAMMGEIWPVCEKLRWTIDEGEKHLRPERVSAGMLQHKSARLEYVPLGVLGAILPWNYPFQNIMNPIAPALMTGNAIVLKPSEWVAWSSAQFVASVRDAIRLEGYSPDLVQVAQGFGETGRAVIERGVDSVLFIGSVRNGRRVLEAAAKNLVPVVLELGGKDPFIVCDDASLEQAVHGALGGTFINCGQNCVASERILVHERIAPAFEARVRGYVDAFRQGPPLASEKGAIDVGAIITPMQLAIVDELVQDAIENGARLVCGGKRVRVSDGLFYAPTVLADVTPAMRIMREEVFGPVMLLCPYQTDNEAIAIANSTEFGLSASVFSGSAARARRIASQLESGMVAINDFGGLTYMAQDLPFGGIKRSGYGRMNGRDGLRALCNIRAVLDERLPVRAPNKLFPVGPRDYETTKHTLRMLYGKGPVRRVRAATEMVRSLFQRGES